MIEFSFLGCTVTLKKKYYQNTRIKIIFLKILAKSICIIFVVGSVKMKAGQINIWIIPKTIFNLTYLKMHRSWCETLTEIQQHMMQWPKTKSDTFEHSLATHQPHPESSSSQNDPNAHH